MFLSQALDSLNNFSSESFQSLSDYLSPELITKCLQKKGVATIRKRRLPVEMVVWSVVGMALFRHIPMNQIVSHLDILLPGDRPFVAPSAIVQARQRLGEETVKEVFEQTQALWHENTPHPNWCGLRLLGVDGTLWRTPDTQENSKVFSRTCNSTHESDYPQVRMVCQMELTSHLITAASFSDTLESEMTLAVNLIEKTPDYSLTIFDKGYYSLGLLNEWQNAGDERHWIIPLKAKTKYRVINRIGKGDEIVELATSPQARNKWPQLPETFQARLITRKINGKQRQILTSMIDPMRYPGADIAHLYGYRWEIELGYREIKQHMLQNRLTLRSKKPDMIRQELWGVLLAYNLVRFQMAKMAYSLEGVEPNQISFNQSAIFIIKELTILPYVSAGNIPAVLKSMTDMASSFVLPARRERKYPRIIKKPPARYPYKPVRKREGSLN